MITNKHKKLLHSVWNCKDHIVFTSKYQRKIFYDSHIKEIMNTIKEQWKGIEIIEGKMAVDHGHLLLSIRQS